MHLRDEVINKAQGNSKSFQIASVLLRTSYCCEYLSIMEVGSAKYDKNWENVTVY